MFYPELVSGATTATGHSQAKLLTLMPLAPKRKIQSSTAEQLLAAFSGLNLYPHGDGTSAMTLRGHLPEHKRRNRCVQLCAQGAEGERWSHTDGCIAQNGVNLLPRCTSHLSIRRCCAMKSCDRCTKKQLISASSRDAPWCES